MLTLDDDQQRAVDAGPGDLFISAGAGSGKTRVLTARFLSAVLGQAPYQACSPDQLLTITFTDKAAGVLTERVRHELAAQRRAEEARRIGDAWISTIHGMCARILRQHAFEAGLDPDFAILDEVGASALASSVFEHTVSRLVSEDDGVLTLVDAYGFESVAAAVQQARSSALTLGIGVADIAVHDRAEAARVLARVRRAFTDAAATFGSLRRVKTVEDNARTAQAAAVLLGAADDASGESDIDALAGFRFRACGSVEGNDETVDRCRALIEEATAALAQLAVTPLEDAFLRLVSAVDEGIAAAKAARGALDFQDLQLMTARLLESRPELADALRSRFEMLMVDEFQDTDALQIAIVNQLARGNVCTVGDEHQSIYAFRSADVRLFRNRRDQVARSVRLGINYRTAPELLDAVNALFASPALLGDAYEPLSAPARHGERRPWPDAEPRFSVRFTDTTAQGDLDARQAEAECIAARVAELVEAGIAHGDIAVLLGAMRGGRADALRAALERRGIPAFLATGGEFFACQEVAEARAFLKVIENPRDDQAVVTLLRGRFTGVSDDSLYLLRRAARTAGGGPGGWLWKTVVSPPDDVGLMEADRAVIERTVQTVQWARRQKGMRPLGELVLETLLRLDVDVMLYASGRDGRRAWANLLKFVRLAEEYERTEGGDIGGLLDHLAMRETHATTEREAVLEGESSAVRVMSIHAAKGLEFPAVVVGALDRGGRSHAIEVHAIDGVPTLGMRAILGNGSSATLASDVVTRAAMTVADEEAIRLLYVACTRAEESLTVVLRTDPAEAAGRSMGGLVRSTLGMAGAGSISGPIVRMNGAHAHVSVFRAGEVDAVARDATESRTVALPGHLLAPQSGAAPGFGAPRTVSYTGLSRYASCPYSYYATAIARLPSPPAAIGTDARDLGVAAHWLLERCVTPGGVSEDDFQAASTAYGLDARSVARLRAAVQTYLGSATATAVFAAERVARETPIAVPVGGLVLTGAVDVLAWRGDEALVVDFKTGAGTTTDDAATERYRLQAVCYALAAFAAGATGVTVRVLEVETGRETIFAFERRDQVALESEVTSLTDRMRAGAYEPRGTYERASCETCPAFGSLCPVTRPDPDNAG